MQTITVIMKKFYFLFLFFLPGFPGLSQTNFSIEILREEARQFLDESSPVEVIGSEFMWTEGPLYIEDEGYLLVSDIPRNSIYKIDRNGRTTLYLKPSGFLGQNFQGDEPGSNGLLLDDQGRLVMMQHGERRIAYMNAPLDHPSTDFVVLTDQFDGERYNSPNDGVFDSRGNLYFTDPIYGLPQRVNDPARELDFCGVFRLSPSGDVTLLDTLSRPNGIALSPNEKKLYVAVSDPAHATWYEYDLKRNGKVGKRKLFYDATHLVGSPGQQGLPDGMAMHGSGNLFASGPGGLWIFNPSGQPIARIYTGKATSNCTFSNDEKTLFVTADDLVLRIGMK